MTDSPLWRFSLDFYQCDGVEAACLQLQDRFGLDVNVLLLCCWLASHGRCIATADIVALSDMDDLRWLRERVIEPLRAARRALKAVPLADAVPLRRDVAHSELAAEALAQRILYDTLGGPAHTDHSRVDTAAAARRNLRACLDAAGVQPAAWSSCRALVRALVAWSADAELP